MIVSFSPGDKIEINKTAWIDQIKVVFFSHKIHVKIIKRCIFSSPEHKCSSLGNVIFLKPKSRVSILVENL